MAIANDLFSDPLFHSQDDLEDDEDETLSFCDLPIYSDSVDPTKEDRSLPSSDNEDPDLFEFSGEDFSASNHEAGSIIFCGKLIPYKEQPNIQKQSSNKRAIFTHKSSSGGSSGRLRAKEHNKVQQVATGVSVLASPVKSRWYLYMFGLARFPVEMELRDIRNRQSRRSPTPMFRSQGKGGDVVSRSRGRGLWGLLRVLGCKSSHHATTVVKSFTCI